LFDQAIVASRLIETVDAPEAIIGSYFGVTPLVGLLHGCLANGSLYDERTGRVHRPENNLTEAA
jgi:hypothetical protein